MKPPVLHGVIERRILANFRIDADVLARQLPAPFRPKTFGGHGLGGICLIRLREIRPRFAPRFAGISSENAAHRFAVEWDEGGETREGVYIPRRDTSSSLNVAAGGLIFPGVHHRAAFEVREADDTYAVRMEAGDGAHVLVEGRIAEHLPDGSIFPDLESASRFFERGALGYSATAREGVYDGLELRTRTWACEALAVGRVESSYFAHEDRFPRGSVVFDHALLMREIEHEWHGREALRCGADGSS